MNGSPANLCENAIIVVAHPDDEILWFSSVIDRVDKILCCYEDCADAPELGQRRRRTLADYPLRTIASLGLAEPLSFNQADWEHPAATPYGIAITKSDAAAARYRHSYVELEARLTPILGQYHNVFTHNPWGEYGHEDHVQVHRVIRALQRKMGFSLWISNYCGNQSLNLLQQHIVGFSSDYFSLPTNPVLAGEIRSLYQRHGCWTWYDDYRWFHEEAFMQITGEDRATTPCGHLFPLNFIKTDFTTAASAGPTSGLRRLWRALQRRLR